MEAYYINHDQFQEGDTTTAFKFALQIANNAEGVDTITFLVLQQQQYVPFLSELGFSSQDYKNHGGRYKNYRVQIHTVKTYKPKYLFAGHPQTEILIAVGVPPKYFEQFEDYSNIKCWIIVPWLLNECKEWLSIFEAKDIVTGVPMASPAASDPRIENAIGWLKATSYPNEGYHHPNDENRLHQMANAIKRYKVPFDYASTVYCALNSGLIPSAARKTAETFQRAQTRAFAVKCSTQDYQFLKEMMERTHE